MSTLYITDEFRRVIQSMRTAHIEEKAIATAIGFSEETLIHVFGRWFKMEGKTVPLKIRGVTIGTARILEETPDHILVQCRITVPMPVRYTLPPNSAFSFELPTVPDITDDEESIARMSGEGDIYLSGSE